MSETYDDFSEDITDIPPNDNTESAAEWPNEWDTNNDDSEAN